MRLKKIKHLLKQKDYFRIFLISGISYLILSFYLIYYFFNGFYLFFNYYIKYYPWLNILFTLTLALLFGINLVLIIFRFKEVRKYNNESGTGIFTSVLSLFSAGCPVCSFTILSFLIPGLSTAFTLAILPFKGLEIQLLGIILLLISIFILTKENVCKVN
ncbi:MAG: hypothetical protein AABX61_00615 [Nanoarchaeota archaeon]